MPVPNSKSKGRYFKSAVYVTMILIAAIIFVIFLIKAGVSSALIASLLFIGLFVSVYTLLAFIFGWPKLKWNDMSALWYFV